MCFRRVIAVSTTLLACASAACGGSQQYAHPSASAAPGLGYDPTYPTIGKASTTAALVSAQPNLMPMLTSPLDAPIAGAVTTGH
jgi:hypothetical protein